MTWFTADTMPRPLAYLDWLDTVARQGKRVVVIGSLGVAYDDRGEATPREAGDARRGSRA